MIEHNKLLKRYRDLVVLDTENKINHDEYIELQNIEDILEEKLEKWDKFGAIWQSELHTLYTKTIPELQEKNKGFVKTGTIIRETIAEKKK